MEPRLGRPRSCDRNVKLNVVHPRVYCGYQIWITLRLLFCRASDHLPQSVHTVLLLMTSFFGTAQSLGLHSAERSSFDIVMSWRPDDWLLRLSICG